MARSVNASLETEEGEECCTALSVFHTQETLTPNAFYLTLLFFFSLLSFARRSSQMLAFCAQGSIVASGIITDADLKMYAEQTACFQSDYQPAGSRATHQNVGVCVHKRSLDFLATRRVIRSRGGGGLWSKVGGSADPQICRGITARQRKLRMKQNMCSICLYSLGMIISFCFLAWLHFLTL